MTVVVELMFDLESLQRLGAPRPNLSSLLN
jgi:hypothetical protein